MSRETRQAHSQKLATIRAIQGHDSTVAHAFEHSAGRCPKCGCAEQAMGFCDPDSRTLSQVPGCELKGEHLHRVCRACRYPWVERCLDQALLAQERGETKAETELASVLAAVADTIRGVTITQAEVDNHRGWILRFERSPERDTITVTSEPPPQDEGTIAHPRMTNPTVPE